MLDGPLSAFERGCEDTFRITCVDIGIISRIRLGHDGKGIGSGWFCQSVKIECPNGTYDIPCSRWFDIDEDDHAIDRELYVNGSPGRPLTSYRIVIVTGVERGSGTDANVFISLIGTEGKLDKIRLDNDRENFETGRIDVFHHECLDLGELKQATIGHNAKGIGSAWLLDTVFIVNEVNNQRWIFPCKQWLDPNQGDKKIERTLIPGSKGSTTYQIKVFTGSARGAGTDANVFIVIEGVKGKTNEINLKYGNNVNLFEDGQCDTFAVDGADVGEITFLNIRHDDTGIGSDWLLDHTEIIDHATGLSWTFPCNDWLKGKGLSKILKAIKME
jgi:ferredoxin-fold anticodon binding domain-containing protein